MNQLATLVLLCFPFGMVCKDKTYVLYEIKKYTYGDSKWKDLLMEVGGYGITYNAIENPLTYYNGTDWIFMWESGKNSRKQISVPFQKNQQPHTISV